MAEQTTAAIHRDTAAFALVSQLRGDLDWVVMRCLEKDRTRRYETANALATDVRCHLENKPVAAGPPSHVYRMQKLIRRNKTVLIASGAVIGALFIGLGVSTWVWLPDRKAHDQLVVAEKAARESEARMREMLRSIRNAQT